MIDLNPDHLAIVERILAEHVPGCEVRAFGSRASWTAKDYSDLDLAIVGDGPLGWRTLALLEEAFEESDLPMRVDVLDWHDIDESFQRVIERGYVIVQERKGNSPAVNEQTRLARLGEVCTKIGSGATPRGGKEVYLQEGPYALIRSQNVYNDRFEHEGLVYIDEQQASALRNVEVLKDDVLLNITGDSVARACQVPLDVLPARVNQHVAIVRPDPAKLEPRYLHYSLVNPEMQVRLLSWAGQGATRNALTKGMIESLEIPLPPLPTQRSIAHVLGTLDDKIELNRRMNETLEEMARALFRSWFVDFDPVRAKMEGRDPGLASDVAALFPDRLVPSDLGPIPEGWEVRPLGEIVELNPPEPMRRGMIAPYLDMAALPTSGPSPSSPILRVFTSGTRFRNGDTLLARITPCLENGKTAFIQSLPENTIGWGSTEFIVIRAVPPVPSAYTYLLARDAMFRAHAIQSMTGSSGRQRARTEAIAVYPVVFPSVAVSHAFGLLAKPMFHSIRVHSEEAHALTAERDALLPRLVRGDLRLGEKS